MIRSLAPMAAGLAALVLAAAPAAADTDREYLRSQLAKPAADMAALLKNEPPSGLRAVKFGRFTPPADPEGASFGTGMREMFLEVFRATKEYTAGEVKEVDKNPDATIEAGMGYVEDDKKQATIQITFTIRKKTGGTITLEKEYKALRDEGIKLTQPAVVAAALGITTAFTPESSAEEQSKQVARAKHGDVPGAHKEGTKLKAGPDQPYAVEILTADLADAPNTMAAWYTSKKVKAATPGLTKEDKPFVDLKVDQAYAIKVYNPTDYMAAVQLSIDGLDVFHYVGNELRKNNIPVYSFYVVKPKSDLVIPGWHKDDQTSYSFVVKEYIKGKEGAHPLAAAPKDPGVLCVRVAAAWIKGGPEPPKELKGRDVFTPPGPQVSTGFKKVENVETGAFNNVISILYQHPDAAGKK